MDEELQLRLVGAFEKIAEHLGDLSVIEKRRYDREYPDRPERRDAVVTRIPTEEDKIREAQGSVDRSVPTGEWFGGFEDKPFVGLREQAYLDEEEAKKSATGPKNTGETVAGNRGLETFGGKPRKRRKRPADVKPVEGS